MRLFVSDSRRTPNLRRTMITMTRMTFTRHPSWRQGSQGSQPYSPGGVPRRQSSSSQAPVWRPFPHAPEPSGIARTFLHANGQVYKADLPIPRRGSINCAGSTSSGAGLHRAGSIKSDQDRSSSAAPPPHGGSDRPSTQGRDHIASNTSIAPRERPTLDEAPRSPTSASPS